MPAKNIKKNKGLYIAIDGPDGSGKSTLINLLCKDDATKKFSEPDRNGQMWPTIRDLRVSGKYPNELWVLILSAASLEQQIKHKGIIYYKDKGLRVFTDRSPLSFLALYWNMVNKKFLKKIINLFSSPEILIVLSPEHESLLVKRMISRGDSLEEISEDIQFAKNYNLAAKWLKKNFNWNIHILNFNETDAPNDIYIKIKNIINKI